MGFLHKLSLTFLALTAALSAWAIVPQVDYMPPFISVDEVVRTPESLQMNVTLNHLPHYWVKIDSGTVLVDRASGHEFRLIGQENIPLNTEIWMPDSGHHSGVLVWEPVSDEVKVVDCYEPNSSPQQRIYGIHLDQSRLSAVPQGFTKYDILGHKLSTDKWDGLNLERYRSMDFVKHGATAVVKGRIDHHTPQVEHNTISVTTRNLITGNDTQTVGEIDSTGGFEFTVPLDYAGMALFRYGDMNRSVFLCPNDTFEIYTSALLHYETEPYRRLAPEYLRYNSTNPDALAITLLYDDAQAKLNTNEYDWESVSNATNDGLDSIMALCSDIKAKMNRLVAEAPAIIDQYPVSPFVKDILFTGVLVDTYTNMLDLPLYWNDNSMIRSDEDGRPVMRPNPDFRPIDVWEFHSGEEAYAPLIYDNPLVMCTGWIFFNRCEFGSLFETMRNIASGTLRVHTVDGNWVMDPATNFEDGESRCERIRTLEKIRQDSCGLGDCFIQQLVIAKNLSHKLSTDAELTTEGMDFNVNLISEMLPLLSYPALVWQVVSDWADINREVGRMEGNNIVDNSRSVDTESDVLAAVIEPYRGNVIYVDVWSMGCGPCRAGMLDQRELIKHYSDQPLTVIYLNTEDEKERAERWMRNNNILGEHVYLSQDNRARLSADFDITGIPYGILIDKKGNIRQTKLHSLPINDFLLQELLAE